MKVGTFSSCWGIAGIGCEKGACWPDLPSREGKSGLILADGGLAFQSRAPCLAARACIARQARSSVSALRWFLVPPIFHLWFEGAVVRTAELCRAWKPRPPEDRLWVHKARVRLKREIQEQTRSSFSGGEGDPASGEQEKVLVSVPDEGALWLG